MRHRPAYLLNISSCGLAESRDRVDGGDTLCQEGVGGELGQLCAPKVGGQDPFLRNPVLVHALEHSHCSLATGSLLASDEDLATLLVSMSQRHPAVKKA